MNLIGNTPRRPSIQNTDEFGSKTVKDGIANKREPYVEGNLKICHTMEVEALTVGGTTRSVEVLTLQYSPDGSVLAVGTSDGSIRIYNADSPQCVYVLTDDDTKASRLPVTSIRFKSHEDGAKKDAKNILAATYASGLIKFWHYSSSQCLYTINEGEHRQTLNGTFNPQGTGFMTCGADPQLNLYDVATKKLVRTFEPSDSRDVMNGHRARVFSVHYHPHRQHEFVTGGWDDTIQFWDDRIIKDKADTCRSKRKIYGPHICGDALDIDPIHNHIVSGSWRKDKVLQIWNYDNGEIVKDVPQDTMNRSMLYCAQWLGRENIVCGGSDQNMVRVIDRGTLNTVGQLVYLPNAVVWIDNDRQLKPRFAVATGSRVYVLKMEKRQ